MEIGDSGSLAADALATLQAPLLHPLLPSSPTWSMVTLFLFYFHLYYFHFVL